VWVKVDQGCELWSKRNGRWSKLRSDKRWIDQRLVCAVERRRKKVGRARRKLPYKLLQQARAPAAYITTPCLSRLRGGSSMLYLLSLLTMA
jgi:hypothetical protein